MTKITHSLAAVVTVAVALCSAGCMVTPQDGDFILEEWSCGTSVTVYGRR